MSHRPTVLLFFAVLILIPSAAICSGQAQAPQDASGVILTIDPTAASATKPPFADARVSRMVALYVPQGSPPSDFTPPGSFRAVFRGDLNLRLRSFISFSAEGRGKFTLALNGETVLETSGDDLAKTVSKEVRLNKGKNQLVATYESPASGDATVRLFWSAKNFLPEPLPPNLLTHPAPEPEVARSFEARDGRFHVAQFRCTKCHIAAGPASKDAMPELAMDAPSLADAGSRLNTDWLAAWIADPHALRAAAHMPKFFSNPTDTSPNDIAAYLATLSTPDTTKATHGNATSGGRIFANLDCIACHTPPDAVDDPTRIPHKFVAAKFKPAALKAFLLNPQAHYAWNPMPNFHLSDSEADDLSAFLLDAGQKLPPATPGNAAKGKSLVASTGCLNCHTLNNEQTALKTVGLESIKGANLAKGCLAPAGPLHGSAPTFNFDPSQIQAVTTFLTYSRASLAQNSPAEFSQRQVGAMRCTACHARDGNESLLAQAYDADSQALHEKFPNPPPAPNELLAAEQKPPQLTYAGGKLRPEWMEQFIAGQISYKPRYYLRARMPAFTARAKLLAIGLAAEEACPPVLPPNPPPDRAQVEEGRKLSGKVPNVGFSCVQCHAAGDLPPFAAFEAPSINLKYVAERLRHDYYMRWIHDPLRIDAASKMPRFDDADGKTGLPAFNNDAKLQFEAIWQYLLEGKDLQPPQ